MNHTVLNGTYTITNPEGEHRTLSVKTQPDDSRFAPGERVVALLTGPNNEADYQGFGFVREDRVNVWRSKRGNGKQSAFDWYAYLLRKGCEALATSDKVEVAMDFPVGGRSYCIQVARRCMRCNKLLTNPESVRRGMGPECAARLGLAG